MNTSTAFVISLFIICFVIENYHDDQVALSRDQVKIACYEAAKITAFNSGFTSASGVNITCEK